VRTRSGCSGSEHLRIGTGCMHGAKQAGNRARPTVQGARHGGLRFGTAAGTGERRSGRCGDLGTTTPIAKRSWERWDAHRG
jgi:hypothetical protein